MKKKILIISLFYIFFASDQYPIQIKAEKQIKEVSLLSDYDRLKNYLQTLSNTLSIENYDAIIFISDKEGSCISCTKSFSNFICQNILNQNRMLVILNAKGDRFETSPYLSDTVKNVTTDYSNDFFRLKIASSATSIIVLKNNEIEKVYPVNPETLSDNITLLARMKYRIRNNTN